MTALFAPVLKGDEISEAEQRELVAVERFWSILERNPRRGTALDRVYGYYIDTGQIDQLIEKCANLTETSPDDGKVWLLQGLIFARRNDDLGAVEALQKAESLDASDAMSSFYLGELLIAQGRLRDAAEALERALERKPAKNDALVIMQTLGRVYERFGDRENSANVWEKMEEMFPNDLGILVRIAETLEEEGMFEEALSRYEKLAGLAKNQNYARVRFTLAAADIKIRLGNKQEAIDDFEKLLDELATDNWLAESVRDRVERVFVRQADYAGLASYYRKQLDKRPNDLNTVHRLAVAMVRLSRTDEAKELLQNTLEKAPSNIKLRLALIDLLVNDKNFDEVDRQYALINELDTNNPDHISQWGLAVLENRNLEPEEREDRAANIWLRLVEARPNDLATLVMVADLMAGKRIDDEAEALYRRAVDLAPNDPTYREYLGYFYHRSKQPGKAVETLKTIAEGDRRTAANLSQLSNILHGLGYLKDAMETAEEAAKLAPSDFALQLRCCELLKENEWLDEAKRRLDIAQKLVETDDELEQYTRSEIELLGARRELPAKTDELMRQADKSAKDWWRLANYLLAAGRLDEATGAIDEAVKLEYPDEGSETETQNASLLVLKTAANIYARGYDQQKAAAIYEKLAALDASLRVEHLKRLAALQRDLGQTDKAIETARLVMATGAGNAANSRFYADMLIAIGRRNDGIEALRRAVRLDPTDTTTLTALADQLAQAGQIGEAIELIWRVYDRTDELQGKLSVITKLSAYYQMSQQFGQLIERLRQGMHDVNGRREAAYCLAQAYASVGDYHAARNSLEILLTSVDEEKTSDTFLLEQLSKVAEMQGDTNAAIRYQEMLCDLSSLAQDNERLLGLYYATGQRDKATAIYTQKVFEQGELIDQINAIDKMLAREDYRPALTLIERLETKHVNHWELMYRKLQAECRLKEGNPEAVARAIVLLDVEDETLSLAHEKAIEQSLKQSGVTTAMMRQLGYGYGGSSSSAFYSGLGFSSGYYGGSSQWSFKGKDGDTYNISYVVSGEMYDGVAPEAWNAAHYMLLPTLFRELLTFDDNRYYGYSTRPSASGSEKPQYAPATFGDAKFAAMFWQLKTAYDRDMEELGLESPYAKERSQSQTTAKPAFSGLSACGCEPADDDLSEDFDEEDGDHDHDSDDTNEIDEDDNSDESDDDNTNETGTPTLAASQQAGEPTLAGPQPQRAGDAKKQGDEEPAFEHFNAMLAELLATMPDDAQADVQDAKSLENRMKFEVFLGYWAALDDELETVTPLKKHATPETTARVESLATRLAFVSEDPFWKRTLFDTILSEVSDAVLSNYYETLDLDACWSELPDDLAQDEQARAAVVKLVERHAKRIKARTAKKTGGDELVPLEKKIDWLVKTYVRESHDEAGEFQSQVMSYRNLRDVLKYSGRDGDISQVDAAFEFAGNIDPDCFYEMGGKPFSPFEFLPTAAGDALLSEAPFAEFGRAQNWDQLQYWLRKGTQAMVNNIKMLLHDDALVARQEKMLSFLTGTGHSRGVYGGYGGYGGHLMLPMSYESLFGGDQLTGFLESEFEKIWNDELYFEVNFIVSHGGLPDPLKAVNEALSAKTRRGLPMPPERSSDMYDLYELLNPTNKDEKATVEEAMTVSPEKLAGIEACRELLKNVLDLRLEMLCEIMPMRDEFLKEMPVSLLSLSPQASIASRRASLLNYADYYFNRYYDFDQYDAEELLGVYQTPDEQADEYEFLDSILIDVKSHAVTVDILLSISKPGEGVEESELQPRFEKYFDEYVREKADAGDEWEQKLAQSVLTFWEEALAELVSDEEDDSSDDTKAIYAELQEEHQRAKDNGQTWAEERLFTLAVLANKNKNYELVIECLDAMPLTAATDVKRRENLFLTLHQQAISNQTLKARAEEAVDRLLGYQLTTDELTQVRTLLKRFDRTDEADAIRDRLLVSATDARTQFTLLQELNRGGEKSKEQAVQYALKVFRSPAMMSQSVVQSDSVNRELKNLAINVLKKHGKLEEIVEQIEEQWKSSPGATDIMISLTEIYSRNNRTEDAKRIAEEIGNHVPDDAQKMLDHAQLLRQVGLRNEAIDWTCKAIEKEPVRLFRDFWEYERSFSSAKQTPRLIELIRNMDAAIIEDNAYYVANQLSQWLQAESTREMTVQLLDSLWNNEKASERQRKTIREYLVSRMTMEPRKEFYPYLKETVFSGLADSTQEENTREEYGMFYIPGHYGYSDQHTSGILGRQESLIKSAKAADAFDEMKAELLDIRAAHEAETPVKNPSAYTKALLFETQIAMDEKDFDRAVEILTKIYGEETLSQHAEHALGYFAQRVAGQTRTDDRLVNLLIEHVEESLDVSEEDGFPEEDDPRAYKTLITLYFKADRTEPARYLTVMQLRQCLQCISRCGNRNQVEVGDETYTIYELANYLDEYAAMLRSAGCDFELWLVWQAECVGQEWYETLEQHDNLQYYASRLKAPFEGLEDSVPPERVAEYIELLVPGLVETQSDTADETPDDIDELIETFAEMMPTDTIRLLIQCRTVNASTGGAIRNAFRFLAEAAMQADSKTLVSPMISSTLLDALKVVAAEDREKFDRIVETLDRLAAENPDEPSFVVARLFCVLASEDATAASERMTATADWLDGLTQERSAAFDASVYLGLWIALRETYSEAEKYDDQPQLAESRERILHLLYTIKCTGYNADGTISSTEPQLLANQIVSALTYEMDRVLPDELLETLKAEQQ